MRPSAVLRRRLRLSALVLLVFPVLVSGALHAADGDLDPDFQAGQVTVGWTDPATAVAIEPLANGAMLIGGTITDPPRWAIAKLNKLGAYDLGWGLGFTPFGFGNDGASAAGNLFDMETDPGTGNTLVAGWVEISAGIERPALARLLPGGVLDPSFDSNGLLVVGPIPAGWTSLQVNDAKILPDGRAVFVGSCKSCPTAGQKSVFVTRRLASGAADTTFSGDGWLSFTASDDYGSYANAVAVADNGNIVIAGQIPLDLDALAFIARLLPSGALDASFGDGSGIGEFPFVASDTRPVDIALDPSSARIAVGLANFFMLGGVLVLDGAGLADTTFSDDGFRELDLEEGVDIAAVAFQSDGKLLAVGTINANGAQEGGFFLARFHTTGALDASFDGNGVKRVEFDAAPNVADGALAVTTIAGKLVAAGFAGAGTGDDQEFAIVRTASSHLFSDGFEHGSVAGWAGY
ncbi:MAG: hypothetical protein ABI689_08315 [Thermoanaerobaculia bacterium]